MFRPVVPAANRFQLVESWKRCCGFSTLAGSGTCFRRVILRLCIAGLQRWCREETLRRVLTDLANTLREEGEIDESDCFIDATVALSSAVGRGLFS